MKIALVFLTLGLFTPKMLLAAKVKFINPDKGHLKLALTKKEAKVYKRGDAIRVTGRTTPKECTGLIHKLKSGYAYVTIENGYTGWTKNSLVNLNPERTEIDELGPQSPSLGEVKDLAQEQNFQILPEMGAAVFPVPAFGITAGYKISSDMAIELNASKGEAELGEQKYDEDPFGITTGLESTVVSVRLKKFLTPYFYGNFGMGYREVVFNGTLTEQEGASDSTLIGFQSGSEVFSASRQDVIFDAAVGSVWQTDMFTIGVDIIGILLPVYEISAKGNDENSVTVAVNNPGNPQIESYEDFYEYELPGISYQAKFYFGVTF